MGNSHIWWQVGSMLVYLTVYQKYKVCQALMYIPHRQRVCGELHIFHDLVLDQNINDNSYSTPLLHEALDVNHIMVMMGIGLYYNISSLLSVQNQHYPEHDTLCLSIFFNCIFSYISQINDTMFLMLLKQIFLELFSHTDIIVLCARMHYNQWIKYFWSWKFNIRH